MKSKKIEDVYPLSPMQQGMLFESLLTPEKGVYIGQICYELQGNLNVSALERSWQQTVDRHGVLKTAFVWEKLEKPIQVVGRHVQVPLEFYDWCSLSTSEKQKQLKAFLEADQHRDFQFSKAPLLRLTLIQLTNDTYQLILTHHHIVLDGWSLPLLFEEVIAGYEAFHLGKELHIKPPRPYRDYILWLQQQDISEAKKYWQQLLKGFKAPTPFLIDQVSDHLISQDKNYAKQNIQLSIAETIALQSLARKHRLTLNTIIQGVWALLLSHYSSETDIVFGSTSSGRPANLIGADSIIGNLINTLPVRVCVNQEELILPWLEQLQNQQIESRNYEYSPLIEIQKWSEVPQGIPLFESIIVFENYPMDESLQQRIGDLKIRKVDSILETNYPLTIAVGVSRKFYIDIIFDPQHFEGATITRMLGHLQTLLVGIIINPDRRLADLPILTATEQHQLLVEWNATQADYPLDKCIHQLFEEQVKRTPEAIAVVFTQDKLTYRELNCKANQLASHLQQLGVKPEMLVGICLERSLEMVISILAILKAGGTYVPLDPAYPQERLLFMVDNASISLVVTETPWQNLFAQKPVKLLHLDQQWQTNNQNINDDNPKSEVTPANLAYIIYTSGSTGQPKGVMIEHRSLCNHMLWMQSKLPLNPSDKVLQKTPFSFDASVWEFYAPLLVGGQLILAQPKGHQDPAYLSQLIVEKGVTILQLVPSLLRMLLEEKPLASCQSLRRVFCGGEVLTRDLQQRFYEQLKNTQLYNLYGPTEATIDTTYCLCSNQPPVFDSIGKPISNVQVYLLDPRLQPVPMGVIGEIYIGGAGIARGYINRPDLTSQSFIPNPFNHVNSSRLYKTGDLARYLPDGSLQFIGRIDHQVKLRGFRIELAEIETQLSQYPGVKQVVVKVREDNPNQQRLVVYLVLENEVIPTFRELRHFLRAKLPEYMIPASFVFLEAFPLTPNGKIDHQALPIPENSRLDLSETLVAPRTPTEEILVQIWSKVLLVDEIGVYDNFFELGSDSILSLQVIAKANQAGLQLTLKQIFEYQNIADLAAVVQNVDVSSAPQNLVTGDLPLTPIQHRFFAQKLADSHHWNQSVIVKVDDANVDFIKQAIGYLLVHHDLLRARFVEHQSGWECSIDAVESVIPFSVIDLADLSPGEQKTTIEETATKLQGELNLGEAPLIRIVWFNLGSQEGCRLLIIIHHLIIDGVSWRILLEDLATAYQQISQGKKIELPAKTTSYKDWAEKLQAYSQSAIIQKEFTYWLNQTSSSALSLPVDFPTGKNTVASEALVSVALTPQETKALLYDISSAYQTQINDVLLTALVQVFHEWTGNNCLLLELEGHGREDILEGVNLSRTVGWFTTIFPVLLTLKTSDQVEQALKTIKEQLRSIPFRGFNYGVLRYLSNDPSIVKQLEALPQPQVRFNYLGQIDQVLSNSSMFQKATESTGLNRSPRGEKDCLLEINGLIVDGQLGFDWYYSKEIYNVTTIEHLAQGFLEKLRSLINHCQSPSAGGYTPSDFALMEFSQSELDLLIGEINE